jgi:DNA-binding LacI/PurR family transcriptional regulator
MSSTQPPKRASIIDVAELAGVSRQTVTRAMNDMPDISEATKLRVLNAAKTLRYRPSRFGRGLVKRGVPSLGLVVVDLTNPYFSQLASSVIEFATMRGWTVLVAEVAHGGVTALTELAVQVDAIVGYLEVGDDQIDAIFGELPVVTLDRLPRHRAGIDIDYEPGMRLALEHLIASGRRSIAMLDSSKDEALSARALVYDRLYREHGFQPSVLRVSTTEPQIADGRNAIPLLRELRPDFDAIIGFNDVVAIGALKQLVSEGVRVPEECAVMGIDGLPFGVIVTPELTTLDLDMREVAEVAMELIVGMSDALLPLSGPEVQRFVSHNLVVRESA